MGPADRSLPPLHRHHHADPGVMVVGDAPAMTGLLDVGLRRLPPKQENHDQGREGQHEDQKGVVGVAEGAHDPMDRAPAPRSATPSGSVVPDSYPGHEKTGTKSHEFGGPRWGSLRQLAVKRFAVKRFQPGISRQARVPVRPRVHALDQHRVLGPGQLRGRGLVRDRADGGDEPGHGRLRRRRRRGRGGDPPGRRQHDPEAAHGGGPAVRGQRSPTWTSGWPRTRGAEPTARPSALRTGRTGAAARRRPANEKNDAGVN